MKLKLKATSNFHTGILLVVAVGVAMGVFVGGVLLVCAARHVRRYDVCPWLTSVFLTIIKLICLLVVQVISDMLSADISQHKYRSTQCCCSQGSSRTDLQVLVLWPLDHKVLENYCRRLDPHSANSLLCMITWSPKKKFGYCHRAWGYWYQVYYLYWYISK